MSIAKSLILLCFLAVSAWAAEPALIPAPQQLKLEDGSFIPSPDTKIFADTAARPTAKLLADRLHQGTGFKFPVHSGKPTSGNIVLTTSGSDPSLGAEGYELTVTPDSVLIRAPAEAGLFYGAQTFLQLLPPEIFASTRVTNVQWQSPCVEIKDQPRFQWRGLMLDVARHFFTKHEVEQVLDVMAQHKLNTFHWHLADDQGWRIEIKRYPKLTEVGAWRTGVNFTLSNKKSTGLEPHSSANFGPDGRYGGYYTQADIREVVRYAAARHITIVPEIEMPGHASAALAAYPQFSCTGGPFNTDNSGHIRPGIYCAGNDGTFDFLENVLTEVFALFPGKYVHVGGDEVSTRTWEHCPKCQARKAAEHLATDRQLESYFIQRIEKFVNAHGKSLIGWSEIREGGLAQNAAIMDWIGGATEAATAGHDVVMTPTKYCYLDHYQSLNHATEPHAIGGFLPLSEVYSFEPIPTNLPAEFNHYILGAQGNLWTEYIPNIKHAEYMIFPRESALAEVTWSPKDARNLDDFLRRLEIDDRRLDEMGINYRRNPTDTGEKSSAPTP
jgi:hexosaminidase